MKKMLAMFVPSSIDFNPSSLNDRPNADIKTSLAAKIGKFFFELQSCNIFYVASVFICKSSYIASIYSSNFSSSASPARVLHFSPVIKAPKAFNNKSFLYGLMRLHVCNNSLAKSGMSSFLNGPSSMTFYYGFLSILVCFPASSP